MNMLPGRLSEEFLAKVRELLHKAAEEEVEYGAAICFSEEKGLFLGEACRGDECGIESPDMVGCPPGSTRVGFFHVHTDPHLVWSESDFETFLTTEWIKIACLAALGQEHILCSDFGEYPVRSGLYILASGEREEGRDLLMAFSRIGSAISGYHLSWFVKEWDNEEPADMMWELLLSLEQAADTCNSLADLFGEEAFRYCFLGALHGAFKEILKERSTPLEELKKKLEEES